jgi:uncharacterized membrane protein YhaH (DUF805 family)
MNWFLYALKKYAVFNGRARRKEFWYFVLISFGISEIFELIDSYFVLSVEYNDNFLGPLSAAFNIMIYIPSLSVTVRRLHDIGLSGYLVFAMIFLDAFDLILTFVNPESSLWQFSDKYEFIPGLLVIGLIFLLMKNSIPGNNEYGPNPKLETDYLDK